MLKSLYSYILLLSGVNSLTVPRWNDQPCVTFYPPGSDGGIALKGNYDRDREIDSYLGIPYAKPPVKDLRFAPPEGPDWSTLSKELNTTTWKPACKQRLPLGVGDYGQAEGEYGDDEDCLYLNIFAPHGYDISKGDLPVLVFLHGSGFFGGAASIYDGSNLVQHSVDMGSPIVYITIEARIGILGFGFGWELQQRGWSNVGVRDIQLSLRWIQDHIWAFGGDGSKVTVSGQSGGADVASLLYLQDNAPELFRSTIVMSGTPSLNIANTTGQASQLPWEALLNHTGCGGSDSIACLQKIDADDLMDAQENITLSYGPYSILGALVDGDLIRESPYQLLEQGKFARLPILIGQTKDEGTVFVPNATEQLISFDNWSRGAPPLEYTNETTAKLAEFYPADPAMGCPFGTGNETFGLDPLYKRVTALNTDISYTAPRRHMLDCLARYGVDQVWTYTFDEASGHDGNGSLGAYHTIDLNYLFGIAYPFRGNFSLSDMQLKDQEMTYWINFVAYTDPNSDQSSGLASWPRWTSENKEILRILSGNTSVIEDTYRHEQTDFLNTNEDIIKIY